ncbi:MAG: type III polyketide synthase [Isosphaeraceae bacterium]
MIERARAPIRSGRTPGLELLGLGTALPDHSVTQDQAAGWTSALSGHTPRQTKRTAALYQFSGIARRFVSLLHPSAFPYPFESTRPDELTTRWRMERYESLAPPLALSASRRALEGSGVEPGRVTHLVTVSCTGFAAPGFDLSLVRGLGLDPGVQRTHVGFMGCHGALNGLRVAHAFAGADPSARVLLCATELCSLHFQFGGGDEIAVPNALFGDGAAAVVGALSVGGREGGCEGDVPAPWRLVASGSCLAPDTDDAMSWRIGDAGFAMTLSPEVPRMIHETLPAWLSGWLGGLGLTVGQVGSWGIHPGGPKILDAVEQCLGLPRGSADASRAVLAECGNMSSPTVLFILERLRAAGASLPCVALGFGPGLAVEAALFA